jgi:hypothetical protein
LSRSHLTNHEPGCSGLLATPPSSGRSRACGSESVSTTRFGFNDATASWIAAPRRYRFELRDTEGREVFAYHLHPDGLSDVTEPHLHAGCTHPLFDLGKAHLPTGNVSLRAVIRCLIVEFGVEPLRPDWQDIVAEA